MLAKVLSKLKGIKKIWPKNPRTRAITIVTIILVVFAIIYSLKALENYMIKRYLATHNLFPPPPVTVTNAQSETWQEYISSVGTLEAIQGIDLAPQVDGIVTKILFHSGDVVKQGLSLIHI